MIRSERIAKKINENIKVWQKDHAKLIVAIDGYAGSGKSTVADYVVRNNKHATAIHLDDLIKHWKDRKQMIDAAKDKSEVFTHDWYRYCDLMKVIRKFKSQKSNTTQYRTYDYETNDFGPEKSIDLSKKILIIDGIFLLHPKNPIYVFSDKKVYLDINFIKADRMRVIREKRRWGSRYVPESHPDNWTKHFKIAYRKYVKEEKPQKRADLSFKI